MSLEPGGRADKYGNQYENRYLARLLLWLVQEQLVSVEVEPLGPAGEGVEYITIDPGGSVFYYQCKLSNGTSDSWTLSDLNRYDVFQRSKAHILRSPQSNYCFISPLLYHGLDELCKRARTNSSPQDFQRYQLNNPQIKKLFKDYARYQGLDPAKPQELSDLLNLLKHSYFEQYSSGTEAVRDLETFCGMTFVGNTTVIRSLLENYANDTGKFGVRISSLDVATYMEQKGCSLRNYEKDSRVTPKIQMLNKQFSDGYQLINNRLLPRSATEALFQHMISGHSVLLHGRAGSGKSGTIQGLIQWLSDANVPYLAIKLDKQTPTGCADAFGVKLGLPESPVFCLKKISAGKPSVLILDQLDALRWAGKHSQNALDVCKEMILQAQTVNKEGPGLLSIVLVSRTFDYENDPGIRNLLRTGDKKTAKWEEVRVEYLTDAEVRQVVGASYVRMPKRLKAILQIPSSLFVWTNLQEQNRSDSIATISELMDTWWRQILQSCLTAGLDRSDVVSCKDLLVARMEQSTSFALPMRLFQDYSQIIDALASNGLLVKTEKLVSFTHQSFLDYFLTNRAIAKIYEGAQITEFIEDTQNQTPNLRYRLLATLQSLCDADEALFLKQCEYILGSDQVRFYYQCAVFEVLGQCDNPSATAIEIAEQYWRNPSWHSIVFQTVYLGHVPFVEHLGQSFPFDWLSEESLTLLTSINTKAPDFVINTLRPFCFQDEDTDRKIFSALCCDACDDSEAMFSLRLELLKQRPSLFSGFWGLSLLFKSQSERAIPLIKAAVQGSAVDSLSNIYFPDEETQRKYAKVHFIQIVAELYPVICEKTANSAPTWPQYRVEKAYQKWCAYEYQESTARKIASFVKFAFTEYAQINPLEMFQVLASYHDTHSAIGHEIALSAVENLPLEQADQAVSWLLSDFSYNLFDYTSDTSDYLASAKRIIMKFSPICRLSLFLQLEKNVCSWKDDVRQMISSYRYRLEYNQDPNRTSPPAYWAYWGHFQKELLPCMEQGRLSAYAKALLGTLKRNKWITAPHYYIGFCIGEMKPVVSPVHSYAEKLSDKSWLHIISSTFSTRHFQDSTFTADHDTFSHSLGLAAQKHPLRFAKLSLRFPDHCFWGYPYAVLNALHAERQGNQPIASAEENLDLICDVIRRFWQVPDINIGIAVSGLIESRASVMWPDDILNILDEIALGHTADGPPCFNRDAADIGQMSAQSLLTRSINCPQGCAINAIAKLLWQHPELGPRYKKTLEMVCAAKDPVVRYAAMALDYAYYNLDPVFSVQHFHILLDTDLRILAAPRVWEILWRSYPKNADYYNAHLISACHSPIEDLAEEAAGISCAIAIFSGDQALSAFILEHSFTPKQQNKICAQAVSSFNQADYHEASKKILLRLIDTSTGELGGFNRLFFDHCIDIGRDQVFLVHLMQSTHSVRLVHTFVEYLNEQDGDITPYADVFKALSISISKPDAEPARGFLLDNFYQCVIRLFDQSKDDPYLRGVFLDIWDSLYASNLQSISRLADLIDQD